MSQTFNVSVPDNSTDGAITRKNFFSSRGYRAHLRKQKFEMTYPKVHGPEPYTTNYRHLSNSELEAMLHQIEGIAAMSDEIPNQETVARREAVMAHLNYRAKHGVGKKILYR